MSKAITFESHLIPIKGPLLTRDMAVKMGMVVHHEEVVEGETRLRCKWSTPELFHDDCMKFVRDGEYIREGDAYYPNE